MNRNTRRQINAYQRRLGLFKEEFIPVPRAEWSDEMQHHPTLTRVWIGRGFMVQGYDEGQFCITRLSVNRCTPQANGDWQENITWEELQSIKDEVGYADFDAVEVYPKQRDIVNVANMRHLWILPQGLTFAWRAAQ
jgi:hypothetical protein